MKKKKRKKLRDKFTDALGEEMTARNLNDKIKSREEGTGNGEEILKVEATKKPPEVTAEVAENIASEVAVQTTEVKVTAEVEVKTAVEIVEVKTDTEFDKRVLQRRTTLFTIQSRVSRAGS